MALSHQVLDVFLSGTNQVPGDRSGVVGRILDAKQVIATHFDPGRGLPRRLKLKQRNGFRTLTTNGHDASNGVTSSINWSNPELLSSVGGQLISIANAVPRVFDDTDWAHYPLERVVTNNLSESVFHTSQRTVEAQDHAWKSGVTCKVWSERPNPEDQLATIFYVGFKSDDGTWVRTPTAIYDPITAGDPTKLTYGRVISDSVAPYFWVVFNRFVTGSRKYRALLFDLNGQQLDSADISQIWDTPIPGFFDIVQYPGGGCMFAQPLHTKASATDGVRFTAFTQTAGVIASVSTDNADIHCRGPLAWLTNNLGDSKLYLATLGLGEFSSGKLWGYQITPATPNPAAHEYDFEIQLDDVTSDSLIGFVTANAPHVPTMTVSETFIRSTAATSGPPWDPQLRFSQSWNCNFADTVTFNRQNDYTCQVSRAFLHDGEYYSINYYQSGSGNLVSSTTLPVNWIDGDYMFGNQFQPLKVNPGDFTTGSPQTFLTNNRGITNSGSAAAVNIEAGDKVELVSSDGTNPNVLGFPFAPAGTPLFKWTFTHSILTDNIGGRLVVASSTGVTGANGTWEIIGPLESDPSHVTYTKTTNLAGGTLTPGTFNHAGTVQVDGRTAYAIPDMAATITPDVLSFFFGGSMVVSGSTVPANNGTKTIVRIGVQTEFLIDGSFYGVPAVWINTGSEATSNDPFDAVISPVNANRWHFQQEGFDDSYVGMNLITKNDKIVGNNIDLPITNAVLHGLDVSSATAAQAEIWNSASLPTAVIEVPVDKTPFTFFLQGITPDYTFNGALIIVTNDTVHTANNGVYQIYDFDPDPSHHIVYALPTDGRTDYRNQDFISDNQSISIVFQTNVNPEFQPCWLMVPLTGTKPVVGRFEYGLAWNDWRFEGTAPPANANIFPLAVTSPVMGSDGWLFALPYRALSFTVGQSIATANGQVVNAAIASSQSTVGIKQFQLSQSTGLATVSSSQLMLPGPMCGEFTASGFNEQGVNFGFEAPFLVSQQVSDNAAALRVGGSYQVVAVAEVTDEDGDRIFSIVSPPLNFKLSGTNNSATYGLRMIQPLDAGGNPVSGHFGVTNRRIVGISLYRTAYQNNTPTTEHHKITLDLNVNGLAPISATNNSGFAFTDDWTATYKDENLDAAIVNNETLYTDKGFLPRFPAPAQKQGDFWKQRSWVVGYDGAIWMSAQKQEGDATWFFPLFRVVLPTTDKPVAVAEMDDYLIVGCEKSMWYIPNANFPDATGREGTLPLPVQLPFTNGCTGHMVTLREGVAYSSTDGGVWLITRDLRNEWLSHPIQDSFVIGGEQLPVTGMAIDDKQRIHVMTGSSHIFVYDQVVQTWYHWIVPVDGSKITSLSGTICFQTEGFVWTYDTSIFHDSINGFPVATPPDVTLASLQFGNVRGLKSLWEMQIVGDYKGPHRLNAVISYPDDDPGNPTTFGPYIPNPSLPYLLAINPMIEQASSYGLRVFADFVGITTPGDSFEFELISNEVGVDPSGLNKFRDAQRLQGS